MTTRINAPTSEWVQVTQLGDLSGSLYCESGSCVLTEAMALPTSTVSDTPKSSFLKYNQTKGFFGVGVTTFIFARAVGGYDAQITVSVSE